MSKKGNRYKLKESIIKRIEEEHVCPRSRWIFICQETSIWIFWGLSVIAGAIAVAVSLFVLSHSQYALFEATHDNYFTFFVSVLPYLWIFLFVTMAILAVKNLRYTKHGYRYHAWQVILSSFVLSLAGGAVLQLFGFGYAIDYKLGKEMSLYMSQEKMEMKLWQTPSDGRLLGRQVLTTTSPTTTVIFEDSLGTRWNLNVSELTPRDLELLQSEGPVRLVGTTSDITTKQFHACGAFPWLLDRNVKIKELSAERQAFINRVYKHKDKMNERVAQLEFETFAENSQAGANRLSLCAQIAPVRRIEASVY